MKFTIHGAPQGTPEWLSARAGRVTGSRASLVLAKGKSGEAAGRGDYRVQLVCERLTGAPQECGFVSKDMEWGTEQEPFARAAYEAATGIYVRQTGFISADEIMVGCSLDGDSDNFTGIQEFKCPKTKNHIEWLLGGVIPSKHIPQLTHNVWVTGAQWCDFVSYDPRLPEHLQLFIVRVTRETLDIKSYEKEVFQFLRDVEKTENSLREKIAKAA